MSQPAKQMLVAFIMVLAANLGFWYLAVIPQEDRVTALASRARAAAPNTVPDTQAALVQAQKDIQDIRLKLPSYAEIPQVLETIATLAREKRLTPGPMVFQPKKTDRLNLVEYVSSVTVTGTYDDLKAFLAGIQGQPSLCAVTQLAFTRDPETPGRVTLKAGLSIYCQGHDHG